MTKRSCLIPQDNSGASKVRLIKAYNKLKDYAILSNRILVSVLKLRLIRKAKRKAMYSAIITKTKRISNRNNGEYLRTQQNSVIMLADQDKFLGNRIHGFVTKEFRRYRLMRMRVLVQRYL